MNEGSWKDEIEFMKSLLNSFAELSPTVKWGADVYTFNGANVVSFGGFKHFFSVWFYNGVFLEDSLGVLVNASEGKTKSLRQWRFTSVNDMDVAQIRAYVEEAIQIEKKGMKIAPAKFEPEPLPEILQKKIRRGQCLPRGILSTNSRKAKRICFVHQRSETSAYKNN